MNKSEFLASLQEHLEDNVPSQEIYSNIQYYNQYISEQIASGKSEAEVLEALGDPHLIAKTIIDADEAVVYGSTTYDESYSDPGSSGSASSSRSYYETPEDEPSPNAKSFHLDLTTWYGKAIVIAIAAVIIFLLISAVSFLLPFILVIALIGIVISWVKRNR